MLNSGVCNTHKRQVESMWIKKNQFHMYANGMYCNPIESLSAKKTKYILQTMAQILENNRHSTCVIGWVPYC